MLNNPDKLNLKRNPKSISPEDVKTFISVMLADSECLFFDEEGERTFNIDDVLYLALPTESAVCAFENVVDLCEYYKLPFPVFDYDYCPGSLFIAQDVGGHDEWQWAGGLSDLKKIFDLNFFIED